MSARTLLDQLLQSGRSLSGELLGAAQTSRPTAARGSGMLSGVAGGALGASAIGLLLGSKKARKVGGKVAAYGGMAALGALAYRAYNDWQASQAQPAVQPRTLDRLPAPEVEIHSRAILVAMIGAAKADGHIDDAERVVLERELGKLGDAADQAWLHAQLAAPLEPATVASHATTPEMAAEMYLASLLVVDEESFMERAYLDELARQLQLDPALKRSLEGRLHAETGA